MITGRNGLYAVKTARDHGTPARARQKTALAGKGGGAKMAKSLLPAVGEGVEVLRSAIPRLCA